MSTGVVTTIDTDWHGDTLAAATVATDTVLSVSTVVDFDEDGGWLVIDGSDPIAYTAIDEDASTITLASDVGAAYEFGMPVTVWDPTVSGGGAQVVEYVATVRLHDDTGTADAVIPHEMIPTAGVNFLIGATVRIDPDTMTIEAVPGREPVLNRGMFRTPLISLTLPVNQTIPNGFATTVTGWGGTVGTIGGIFGRFAGEIVVSPGSDGIDLVAPGAYLVVATIDWANNTSGGRTAELVVERDGVDIESTQAAGPPASGGRSTQQVVDIIVAEGNERVRVDVTQASGADLDVRTGFTKLKVYQAATEE